VDTVKNFWTLEKTENFCSSCFPGRAVFRGVSSVDGPESAAFMGNHDSLKSTQLSDAQLHIFSFTSADTNRPSSSLYLDFKGRSRK
jgi:hypothetical protein